MKRWSDLTWLEQWLIVAARRRCNELSTAPRGNPDPDASEACYRFLVQSDPVYTSARPPRKEGEGPTMCEACGGRGFVTRFSGTDTQWMTCPSETCPVTPDGASAHMAALRRALRPSGRFG